VTQYTENPDCMSHDTLETIIQLPESSSEMTLQGLLDRGKRDLAASEAVVEFSRDVIHKLACPRCGAEEDVFAPVGSIDRARGQCPACSKSISEAQIRVVHTLTGYSGQADFADRTVSQLGLPLFDIFTVRSAESEVSYCMDGDAAAVLGPLAANSEVTV
jgi:hypothetical protein